MHKRVRQSVKLRPLATACLVAGLLCFREARALDPTKAITQYVQDVWTTRDGLPQNSVHSIAQTRDGYIWLATQEGLARFDGVRFTVFDRSNTSLRRNYITALVAARDGGLWIGTGGGGLTRFHDGWTTYTTRDGLLSDYVGAVFEDREGSVWIATLKGVNRLQNGRLSSYGVRDGLPGSNVVTVYEDREGNLWFGFHGGGLARFRGGRFTTYTRRNGLPNDAVWSICEDGQGILWIGTEAGGLTQLKGGKFTTEPIGGSDSRAVVLSMLEDRDGSLWLGTYGHGLRRRRHGKWEACGKGNSLSEDAGTVFEDREGNLWIGSFGGGVNRLANSKFTTYGREEGLSGNSVMSVLEDRVGRIWAGTLGAGLNSLTNGTVTVYKSDKGGVLANNVASLWEDRGGVLWLGTWGGVKRIRNGDLVDFGVREGLPRNGSSRITGDRFDNLWSASKGGLYRLKDRNVTFYPKKDGVRKDPIFCVLEDHEGVLWVGTAGGGLDRLENGRLIPESRADQLQSDVIDVLYEDAQGTLWIGTNGRGLARLKAGRLTVYAKKDGLFDDSVFQVLEDDQGFLWMGCNRGISRVRKRDFDEFDAGRLQSIPHVAYGREDGMRSIECNGIGQPSGWKSRDGRLWFATQGGVVVVDPAHLPSNSIPPPVSIEEVLVDDRLADERKGVRLSPDARRLEIHYTGLSFSNPAEVRFRYRLENFDREWIDAGARRVAYYTNLPPGGYRFRVIACNNDGIWNEDGASLSFVLDPPFYRTNPFYAISVLVVAAAVYGGHRLHVRSLKKNEQELGGLVQERTASLNEAKQQLEQVNSELERRVADGVAALRDAERFAAYGRLVLGVAHEVRNPIFTLQTSAYVLVDKLGACTEVQPELKAIERETARLRDLMEELLEFAKPRALLLALTDVRGLIEEAVESARSIPRPFSPTITSRTSGSLPEVVMDRGRMLQVLSNLIENACKHARATRIEVSAEAVSGGDAQRGAADLICLCVEDNGEGIDLKNVPHLFEPFFTTGNGTGLGLAIVRRIVTEHGGEITVELRRGEGTIFTVLLPLSGPPGAQGAPFESAGARVRT